MSPFLHIKIHLSVLILDTIQFIYICMYVNSDTGTQHVGITKKLKMEDAPKFAKKPFFQVFFLVIICIIIKIICIMFKLS